MNKPSERYRLSFEDAWDNLNIGKHHQAFCFLPLAGFLDLEGCRFLDPALASLGFSPSASVVSAGFFLGSLGLGKAAFAFAFGLDAFKALRGMAREWDLEVNGWIQK